MAWVAVDKDGGECIFLIRPTRAKAVWSNNNERYVELPFGTIKKLIGKPLVWEDEPVELT